MTSGVTLHHWEPNANSGKPMLTLAEKGVPFASVYIDLLAFDQHKPEYLAINPMGTIPAMVHGDRLMNESTAIMEYIEEAFPGPALMPASAVDKWRVRWWMKFVDQWLGPSFSMIGWSMFIGPQVRQRDPDELKAAIDRIPLPERRTAWRKAIYGLFHEAELTESRRRVQVGIDMLEEALGKREYLGSDSYSLADINVFNSAYVLPAFQPDAANDVMTPNIMRWLRAIARRPAVKETWAMSRNPRFSERLAFLNAGQG